MKTAKNVWKIFKKFFLWKINNKKLTSANNLIFKTSKTKTKPMTSAPLASEQLPLELAQEVKSTTQLTISVVTKWELATCRLIIKVIQIQIETFLGPTTTVHTILHPKNPQVKHKVFRLSVQFTPHSQERAQQLKDRDQTAWTNIICEQQTHYF